MSAGISLGSSFFGPENVWYIFGGTSSNSGVQVQSLNSVFGSWATSFPTVYNGNPSEGHCAVQVRHKFSS